MAIALGARPDESAKMVCSRGCIAYLPAGHHPRKAICQKPQAEAEHCSLCVAQNNRIFNSLLNQPLPKIESKYNRKNKIDQ
jgi:hypothetical protein